MRSSEPTKAQLFCLDQGDESITFQFNPTSFQFSRQVTWAEGKNAGQPWTNLSFSFGGNDTLNVSLLLDTTEPDDPDSVNDTSVLEDVIKYYKLTMPLKITDGADDIIRPPVVAFLWEQFQFQGVVTGLDVELLMFDESGRATRATVNLSLLGKALAGASSAQEFFSLDYTAPTVDAASGSAPDGDPRLDIIGEMDR
jgi:hypothetical protein